MTLLASVWTHTWGVLFAIKQYRRYYWLRYESADIFLALVALLRATVMDRVANLNDTCSGAARVVGCSGMETAQIVRGMVGSRSTVW